MQRSRGRSPKLVLRAMALAIATLLIGAAGAQASVSVNITGATLTVTGGTGDDGPTFNFIDNGIDYGGGTGSYIRVVENDGVDRPLPAGCYEVAQGDDPNEPGNPIDRAQAEFTLCDNVASDLVLNLDGGSDDPEVIDVCFPTVTMNLGEGDNSTIAPPCTVGALTVNTGAGVDSVSVRDGSSMAITGNLGAGDDHFTGGAGNNVARAGEGQDTLNHSPGNDQHFGEGGNDEIKGGAGNDVEDGGPGDDKIGHIGPEGNARDNDQGADTVRGGDGTDILTLDGHIGGMTINLNGQPDDGASGEGDNIGSDFERILGSRGNDGFFGTPGPDKFEGNFGNDEAHGADGDDDLDGMNDDDRIFGDAGNDKVQGGVSTDVVDGGPGRDEIWADIANCNFISCSAAPDELFAQDGERDAVDCGGGAGVAHVDQLDLVAFCTNVDKQNVFGPDPDPDANDTTAPVAKSLKVKPSSFVALSKGASIVSAGGALASYTLTEVATLTLTVEQAVSGRKSGKKCVKAAAKKKPAGKRCTFYKKLKGSFAHEGAVGANSFRASGRLKNKKLKVGGYRLTGTPTDAANNKGKPVAASFKIKRK